MIHDRDIEVGILHGAGYVGFELIRLALGHPDVHLRLVTSTSQAGRAVAEVHPSLAHQTQLCFLSDATSNLVDLDVIFVAAPHGKGALAVKQLLDCGYRGKIIDMSADFRLKDVEMYEATYGVEHPISELLKEAVYGLPELSSVTTSDALVANPGCFATGLLLALAPLAGESKSGQAHVTALTGASGSGNQPNVATHFPTRDGNVRAYGVFNHRHLAEVNQIVGDGISISFVPASGPWTRGIWGVIHFQPDDDIASLGSIFKSAYVDKPFVRLWPGVLPELRFSVGTPFCDIGWVRDGDRIVIGFALDNLLKGAASQAFQNMNLMMGLCETTGLLSLDNVSPYGAATQK